MKKHLKSILGILTITGFLILPFLVFAQEPIPVNDPVVTPRSVAPKGKTLEALHRIGGGSGFVTDVSLPSAAGTIINVFLSMLGVIFIALIIFSGFKWLTAGGQEKQVEDAKKYITRAVIGLIITLSAWSIWIFIEQRLLN